MKVKNRIKRTAKALIAIYFAVIICFIGGITAFAWNVDTLHQSIALENAPEGTVFADILVKDKKNDKYAVDFNEENGKLLGVGKDCGLANYDTDGYTSMLLRHNCAVFESSEQKHTVLKLKEENSTLFGHFRSIKVAYCDKDGNILGTTNEVKVKKVTWGMPAYTIKANGSSLTCDVNQGPAYFMIVLVPVMFIALALIITAVVITARLSKKLRLKKSIKRIQSGEVDNEQNE
ncbi:hypothetical protein [uncultured Ruminococcus sp.]|uniref:hypothetical protein n=1 Tax=uncultured Ruminococcus sp. TaxID=165186 RepID=UPI0025DF7F9A|nr:hypothetical protein [uncultured Ruminococcus sp.]